MNSKLLRSLFLVTAVALTTAVLGCSGHSAAPPVGPSAAVHDFAAVDLKGVPFRLSDHHGKVVLINFFATWCAPCLNELPYLVEIYEANKAKGLVLVMISADGISATADVRAFNDRHGLKMPVILDDDLRISSLFNPTKVAPFSVLIDRSGRTAFVRDGYVRGDETALAQDVAAVVAAAN